jgi:hypothetical protein
LINNDKNAVADNGTQLAKDIPDASPICTAGRDNPDANHRGITLATI